MRRLAKLAFLSAKAGLQNEQGRRRKHDTAARGKIAVIGGCQTADHRRLVRTDVHHAGKVGPMRAASKVETRLTS